ncbi:class I SAM-dependent DNA methyltransferase [Fodinicola acaciae]|uniref:class I SAM-dependent DNA methyltransferase n=1 Tax=Fodinicola acaciae TaxID=2681555 RepID=UPI0013D46D8F|nr:class I SAM-dependent methyltransferase [Fodinicola acaciae]
MSFLETTRIAYDTVAESYAEFIEDDLPNRPVERSVLGLFAEVAGGGPVVEVGCGQGRVAAHLDALGVDAAGIDLSPEMIAQARKRYPGLRFEVGTMTALDLPDAGLAGLVAWYSIIHVPPALHPDLFLEFRRVLRPGGFLLLAFHVGDETRHVTAAYGHDNLSYDAHRLPPERVADQLVEAGFAMVAQTIRQPIGWEPMPQAFLLATLGTD